MATMRNCDNYSRQIEHIWNLFTRNKLFITIRSDDDNNNNDNNNRKQ